MLVHNLNWKGIGFLILSQSLGEVNKENFLAKDHSKNRLFHQLKLVETTTPAEAFAFSSHQIA